jgi:methionyl-tRNA synthetase
MEAMDFRKSAIELRSIWVIGNEYLQKAQPWARMKTEPVSAEVSIRYALNLAMVFAALAQPFVPDASRKIAQAFAGTEGSLAWPSRVADALIPGAPISVPGVLFAKVEDEQLATWIERFGGPEKKSN